MEKQNLYVTIKAGVEGALFGFPLKADQFVATEEPLENGQTLAILDLAGETDLTDAQHNFLMYSDDVAEFHTGMDRAAATRLATEAVATLKQTGGDAVDVADSTALFVNDDGEYSVADNGEEVDGLTEHQAIRVIVENLTGIQ